MYRVFLSLILTTFFLPLVWGCGTDTVAEISPSTSVARNGSQLCRQDFETPAESRLERPRGECSLTEIKSMPQLGKPYSRTVFNELECIRFTTGGLFFCDNRIL